MTILFGLLAVLFNMYGAKHLPLFEGIILLFNILGFFAVCIPLWVLSPKAPTHEVWFSFNNGGKPFRIYFRTAIRVLTFDI